MRRTLPLACLLLSLIAAPHKAAAQTESAAVQSVPDSPPLVLRLPAATALYHIGDGPRCALPPGAPGASACVWHNGPTPLTWHLQSGWHRSEIDLPPQLRSAPELSLLVQGARPVFEVYADGTLIGRSGSFASHNGPVYDSILVPIPARVYRKGHLSLAIRHLNGPNPYVPTLLLPALGTPAALIDLQKSDTLAQLAHDSQYFLSEIFLCGAGILFLLLFFLDRTSREYLWLALFLISISVPHIADIGQVVNIGEPFWFSVVFYGAFNALFSVAMVEFPFALIRRPVWPVLRIVQALLCLYLFMLLRLLPWSYPHYIALQHWLSPLVAYVFIPVLIPACLVLLVAVPTCFRSRQREMQWVGAALTFLAVCLTDRYLGQLGFPFAPQSLRVGAVALDFTTLSLTVFSAVMIVTMLIRFRRIQSRNQTVEQDLAAARSVRRCSSRMRCRRFRASRSPASTCPRRRSAAISSRSCRSQAAEPLSSSATSRVKVSRLP